MINYKNKYIKYKQKYILFKNNIDDIIKIKNKITLTEFNIKYFVDKSNLDKKILKFYAKKYNHNELFNLLNFLKG